MGKITYYVAASIDGYIADADGGVDWLPQGDPQDYGYTEFYGGVEALVMGRRTYDQVLEFGQWPYSGKTTYVFTSHAPAENPYGVRFVSDTEPEEFIRTTASEYSGTIWLVGGGNLAEQFRRAGLIDEYLVHVIPVILGRGIPLFGGDAPCASPYHSDLHTRHSGHYTCHSRESGNPPPTRLELIATQSFDDGVVMLRYRPLSPLDSGSRPE